MGANDNPTDWRRNAEKRRIKALLDATWSEIVTIYDDRSWAAHMVNILRSKGISGGFREEDRVYYDEKGEKKVAKVKVPIYRDPYYLGDPELLKIMETYREELDIEALESLQITNDEGTDRI